MACQSCTDLVGVSTDCAAIWHDIEPARREKVSVITNGIDLAAFPFKAGRLNAPPRAVSVARLSAVKDPITLLQATRRVLDEQPAFRLDLVGDGPPQGGGAGNRRSAPRRRGSSPRRSHHVRPVLEEASFFVLSSTSEGVSLTLLEAMASGLPVMATRVGGTPEVVEHGKTGILVPPRAPEALADAMLTMLRKPWLRQRMSLAARRRVEDRFDIRKTVDAYEQMYLRAFDGTRLRLGSGVTGAESRSARGATS